MKISVFGIGYVGAVTSACLVKSGHDVIAVDVDEVKVKCISEGRSPIIEPELQEIIAKGVADGKLKATTNMAEAVNETDISLICVGTPSRADGSLQLDYVVDVCEQIGAVIKQKGGYHVVVLRSTVLPGTAKNVAIPALERASGKKAGEGFGFGNNPEFLRESTAVFDYYNPPKIVIGAEDDRTAKMISDLYADIDAPEVVTTVEVSEGVKYADNSWHAMKVGFANELGNILKELGVDSHKVMDIFFMDTKLNISKAYLKPGFAFGGSCLPKDVRAIRSSGKANGLQTPIFDSLLSANDEQVKRAYDMVKASGAKKIGMLGLSFKADTDDLRESPLVTLADLLLKNDFEIIVYDENVSKAKTMGGANQKYINENIKHISDNLVEDADEIINKAEVIIVGNSGQSFPDILSKCSQDMQIIDLVRIDKRLESREKYSGICW